MATPRNALLHTVFNFHFRRNEYEADAISMRLMSRAGMDPRGAVAALEKHAKLEEEVRLCNETCCLYQSVW